MRKIKVEEVSLIFNFKEGGFVMLKGIFGKRTLVVFFTLTILVGFFFNLAPNAFSEDKVI